MSLLLNTSTGAVPFNLFRVQCGAEKCSMPFLLAQIGVAVYCRNLSQTLGTPRHAGSCAPSSFDNSVCVPLGSLAFGSTVTIYACAAHHIGTTCNYLRYFATVQGSEPPSTPGESCGVPLIECQPRMQRELTARLITNACCLSNCDLGVQTARPY